MKPILNDPNIEPTKDVLQSTLGDNFKNYETLLQTIDRMGLTAEWRYYNDGKSWLCKVSHKKKTAFWLSVWADCFKTTFYFTGSQQGININKLDKGCLIFNTDKKTAILLQLWTIPIKAWKPIIGLMISYMFASARTSITIRKIYWR